MKVVGVIPARYDSTRLPGKMLIPICGKPLIQWVYERARQARHLDQLVVAADDERIADAVRGFGGNVMMTAKDHPSGTDRVAEAVEAMDASAVINIQGDEPLVDPRLIDRLADVMRDGVWDMATAASPIRDPADLENHAAVKVVFGQEGHALYFSRSRIPHVRDGNGEPVDGLHWRHIGIYAYRRSFLELLVQAPPCELELAEKLEQLRALYIGGRMTVLTTDHTALGVDTPDDIPKAEAALKAAGLV